MKWRRQQAIGRFVVDFYCAEHRLALEIDGSVHGTAASVVWDGERAEILRSLSVTVVRIRAGDVTVDRLTALLQPWSNG